MHPRDGLHMNIIDAYLSELDNLISTLAQGTEITDDDCDDLARCFHVGWKPEEPTPPPIFEASILTPIEDRPITERGLHREGDRSGLVHTFDGLTAV